MIYGEITVNRLELDESNPSRFIEAPRDPKGGTCDILYRLALSYSSETSKDGAVIDWVTGSGQRLHNDFPPQGRFNAPEGIYPGKTISVLLKEDHGSMTPFSSPKMGFKSVDSAISAILERDKLMSDIEQIQKCSLVARIVSLDFIFP